MAARALKLWKKYERRWKRQFFHRTGVLWMAASPNDAYERGSFEPLRRSGIPYAELSTAKMRKRWPQINFAGVEWGIYEPECGYLDARASCGAVVEAFVAQGGRYVQRAVLTDGLESAPLRGLTLSDGSHVKADGYVFACGPWLGRMFPRAIGDLIRPTQQDVFFFGPPAGDVRFDSQHCPVWADHRDHFIYGVPGSGRRGFKVADDTRGPVFDPTSGERVVSQEGLRHIREYVGFRFPAMKDAPLIETRVCQYEETPDGHLIVDRHPQMEDVWLLGGGSGHGFKHGPAIGEMMAKLILKGSEPDATWRLKRFPRTTH
jgi:glycine/D-amino acid oxidase-like deaminating enzyme